MTKQRRVLLSKDDMSALADFLKDGVRVAGAAPSVLEDEKNSRIIIALQQKRSQRDSQASVDSPV